MFGVRSIESILGGLAVCSIADREMREVIRCSGVMKEVKVNRKVSANSASGDTKSSLPYSLLCSTHN